MELTKEQQKIHDSILAWLEDSEDFLAENHKVLAGYAGTGKTTLAIKLVDTLHTKGYRVAAVTFTGKASDVLAAKFREANVHPYVLSTIHSLFYMLEDSSGDNLKFREKEEDDMDWGGGKFQYPDLILVDEMSMLPQEMVDTIKSHGIPVLFTGDPGQLGAVEGETAEMLFDPDYLLKQIHRQAEQNSIIQTATAVRKGEKLTYGKKGDDVFIVKPRSEPAMTLREKCIKAFYALDDSRALGRGTFLCATNKSRVQINTIVRKALGVDKEKYPVPGETIVCLQNNRTHGLKNGTICRVLTPMEFPEDFQKRDKPVYGKLMVDPGTGFPKEVLCYLPAFGKTKMLSKDFAIREAVPEIHFFDFAYCLTVHKAQGSEWDSVYLINSRMHNQSPDDYKRWLYTGVTRASGKLVVCGV